MSVFVGQDRADRPPCAPPRNCRSEVKLVCLQTVTGTWMPKAPAHGKHDLCFLDQFFHCIDAKNRVI